MGRASRGGLHAEELSAIRDGALPYDALLAAAEALQQQMREAVGRSVLGGVGVVGLR